MADASYHIQQTAVRLLANQITISLADICAACWPGVTDWQLGGCHVEVATALESVKGLVPVYRDRRSWQAVCWAWQGGIPELPLTATEQRPKKPGTKVRYGYTEIDSRYRYLLLGVLPLTNEDSYHLSLEAVREREMVNIHVLDRRGLDRQWLCWYEPNQQIIFGLYDLYAAEGVSFCITLRLERQSAPGQYAMAWQRREQDADYKEDLVLSGQLNSGRQDAELTTRLAQQKRQLAAKLTNLQQRIAIMEGSYVPKP